MLPSLLVYHIILISYISGVKNKLSLYVSGRKQNLWLKWKRAPKYIDAILMYAQRGHGKRSSFYSDFTFGVATSSYQIDNKQQPLVKKLFITTHAIFCPNVETLIADR